MAALAPEKLAFGTMRLDDVERHMLDWVDFFAKIHEMGIRKIHSSAEYETFPMLCEILDELRLQKNISFGHIIKLAEPSFDDSGFSAARLEDKIDYYLSKLSVPHIDDVQWMWRNQLDDDENRINAYTECFDEIFAATEKLKASSKIGRFMCFPYSRDFAAAALRHSAIDGLLVYRNQLERDYDELISRCSEIGKPVLVIRPLNAGNILKESDLTPAEHFRLSLDMPAIEAGIISSNNLRHLRDIIAGQNAKNI